MIFVNYKLIIDARIDINCIGIALHIETDEIRGISFYSLPTPIRCFMLNISEKGILLPHIFDRNIIHKSLHYWPFYNATNIFEDIKRGKFFKLIVRVKKNKINISVGNQSFLYYLSSLDYSRFENTECLNEYFKKKPTIFKKYIQENVLNKLNMGSFGFRIHPGELATIKRLALKIY